MRDGGGRVSEWRRARGGYDETELGLVHMTRVPGGAGVSAAEQGARALAAGDGGALAQAQGRDGRDAGEPSPPRVAEGEGGREKVREREREVKLRREL